MSTFERLNAQQEKQQSWKEKAKKALEEQELKECTFAPMIKKKSAAAKSVKPMTATITVNAQTAPTSATNQT